MRLLRHLATLFVTFGAVAVAALSLAACAQKPVVGMPERAQRALEEAKQVEVVSVNPSEHDGPRMLQGEYGIMGSTMLRGEDVEAVAEAIKTSAAGSTEAGKGCFEPRHALAFIKAEKRYLIVISYDCSRFEVFERDERIGGGTFSGRPALLNGYLDAAGVPRMEPGVGG